MKSIVKKTILLTICLAVSSAGLFAQSGGNPLDRGISEFRSGRYDDSLTYFRDVVIDSNLQAYHSDAYFWIAKSYIALRELDNAEENLEFFILNFPEHRFYEEALYQKGRLMFLQSDFENCIQESHSFLEKFPKSPYAANAFYWSAESLYSLGRLEEAESIFTHIIYNYPSSYKVESATYRLAMIEQKYREESLVELLKLTHEEYLKSIEEFQVREKTYENALDSYQKKLSLIDDDSDSTGGQTLSLELLDLQTSLRNKDNEIMALKRKNAELEYRLDNAESKAAEAAQAAKDAAKVIEVNPEETAEPAQEAETAAEAEKPAADGLAPADKIELLELKSRAQDIKSFYLKYLGNVGN